MSGLSNADQRAAIIKTFVLNATKDGARLPSPDGPDKAKPLAASGDIKCSADLKENVLRDMESAVKQLAGLRTATDEKVAVDMSFGQYAQHRWGFGLNDRGEPESLFEHLGLSYSNTTVAKLFTFGEVNSGYNWLVPEVFRTAIMLGLDIADHKNWIAAEESFKQPSIVLPDIKGSNAMPKDIGEKESIPLGSISFGQKTVTAKKQGVGLEISQEVIDYVPLNVLGLYLSHVGRDLNVKLDREALTVIINGDQIGGTDAIPTIGVTASGTLAYKDILKGWVRLGRLGKMPTVMISGEDVTISILELAEFKAVQGQALKQLTINTPLPQTSSLFVNGNMTASKLILLDPKSSLIKLNVQPVRMEMEKIVMKQIQNTAVTVTTGFAKLFQDGNLMIDVAAAFSSWPTILDIDAYQKRT